LASQKILDHEGIVWNCRTGAFSTRGGVMMWACRTIEFGDSLLRAFLRFARLVPCVLGLLFAVVGAHAQDTYTRTEIGAEFSTVRQTLPGGGAKNYPGFGGRIDWNLTRRLAIESQVDFFPEHSGSVIYKQGGQTLQAVAGLRAKVIQTRRLSVFGLVRPGMVHFTDVLYYTGDPTTITGVKPFTYFVLNIGGGLEYYLSDRWALRADIEGDPYRVANATVSFSGGGTAFVNGKMEDTTRLSFGVAYRPGASIENQPEHGVDGRLEVGPLFTTMISAREGAGVGVRTDPGFGGYTSYKLYKVFYLDGDLLYFPRDTSASGAHDGGQILQTLVGVKGGIRRNHFGFFGKVRPGFNSYSKALTSITMTNGGAVDGYDRSTSFALDLGGIIEFYPAEHGTFRLEVGDTHLFFGNRNVNDNGMIVPSQGGDLRHSIEFITGYGWRF
jgi:Outer membrane protein beta-barrel domain